MKSMRAASQGMLGGAWLRGMKHLFPSFTCGQPDSVRHRRREMGIDRRGAEGDDMRGILIALVLLTWGTLAAEAAGPKEKPAPVGAKKIVCVISEVSQRFELKKIGLMVFANEEKIIPVTSWKLDEKIVAKTKALLAKDFVVKSIPAPYEVFQPLHEPGGLFRDSAAELKGMVQKVAVGTSCDFYFVATCGGSQFSSSNQYLTGLGVVETGTEVFGHNREIYALSYLYVYDGKSFELIRAERGGSDKPLLFQTIRGPSQEVGGTAHVSMQAVADDPKTRDIVWTLLERSLDLTVPTLFEVKALETAVKEKAEVAKNGRAKKDDWAPF
jgi:hypothetical protein